LVEISGSSDRTLQGDAELVKGWQFDEFVSDFARELHDENQRALHALNREEQEQVIATIERQLLNAQVIQGQARLLATAIEKATPPASSVASGPLAEMRTSVASVIRDTVQMAAVIPRSGRPSPEEPLLDHFSGVTKAVNDWKDRLEKESEKLDRLARTVEQSGSAPEVVEQARAFVARLSMESAVDVSIIEVMAGAVTDRLLQNSSAKQAAAKLIRTIRDMKVRSPNILAVPKKTIVAREGGRRVIKSFKSLPLTHQIVAVGVRELTTGRGKPDAARIADIHARVRPRLEAHKCRATSESSVRAMLRRLAEEGILEERQGDRDRGGGGGALLYRLTNATASRFSECRVSEPGNPAGTTRAAAKKRGEKPSARSRSPKRNPSR
jgi:hypothetical protein